MVGVRVAVGEAALSTSESDKLNARISRSALKVKSAERRAGAVLSLRIAGAGICAPGSYNVSTLPLAIIRTIDSRSSRNCVLPGSLRFA